ncbi:MAG: ABC transporter ATP-binding protein [Dehalococcoidia bacterium]
MMAHGTGAADWGDEQDNAISWPLLGRILRYARPYRKLIVFTLLLVLVSASLSLIPPLLIKQLIDGAIPSGDRTQLVILAAAMIAIPVVTGLVQVAQNWGNTIIGQRMMHDVRRQLYSHVLRMPLSFFTATRSGEIMTRLTNDVNGVQQVVTTSFTNVMTNTVTVATTVGVMVWLDWRLAIVALIALPAFIFPTQQFGNLRFRAGRRAQAALGEMTMIVQEKLNISGAMLVKTFGREQREEREFDVASAEVMKEQVSQSMVGRWFFMIVTLYGAVAPAMVYGYGGWLVINGDMLIGEVVAFVFLVNRLFGPVSQLFSVHVDIAGSFALFERIFDYLDMEPSIAERADPTHLPTQDRSVAFEHVDFGYDAGVPVLKDVTFEAKPGELVALVGPSGAGKTTVTYLVSRLYDPESGVVTLDRDDVRDLSFTTLTNHIGMVTQETYLFHASVKDNLLYARPDATDEEIEAAAKAAHVHEVVAQMPRGYDTLVGERGYRLSGGEKQRIAIARIILKDPRILLLDEATSSLDSQSERLIKEALDLVMQSRTSIVIAHRLSTIMAADQILVMDGGRIVERGKHAELVGRGGLYAQLYHEQFKDGAVDRDTPLLGEGEDAEEEREPVVAPAHAAMAPGHGGGEHPGGMPGNGGGMHGGNGGMPAHGGGTGDTGGGHGGGPHGGGH